MDPVACILAYLTRSQSRRDTLDALRSWYGCGGFRPPLSAILAEADRRGIALRPGWGRSALHLGAVR